MRQVSAPTGAGLVFGQLTVGEAAETVSELPVDRVNSKYAPGITLGILSDERRFRVLTSPCSALFSLRTPVYRLTGISKLKGHLTLEQ